MARNGSRWPTAMNYSPMCAKEKITHCPIIVYIKRFDDLNLMFQLERSKKKIEAQETRIFEGEIN